MYLHHRHPAFVVRWRDADTVILKVHNDYKSVGLDVVHRLTWIQAPEQNTTEGKTATARANALAPVGSMVIVETYKLDGDPDGWGRWLANIYCEEGSVSEILLKEGLAKPYVRK